MSPRIQEEDVNRKAHAEGVNAPAGPQPERRAGRQRGAAHQPEEPLVKPPGQANGGDVRDAVGDEGEGVRPRHGFAAGAGAGSVPPHLQMTQWRQSIAGGGA